MISYKPEQNAELCFSFPKELTWYELDVQGKRLPEKMKLVDLVIERDNDILMIEIKDLSNTKAPPANRESDYMKYAGNEGIRRQLTPKARDSYTYIHLMEKDTKPIKFIVLFGLDAYNAGRQEALILGFKGRLKKAIKNESFEPWKRNHIKDCLVLSEKTWNSAFPQWPVTRISQTP